VKKNLQKLILQEQLTQVQSTLAALRRRSRFENARFNAVSTAVTDGIAAAEEAHAEIVQALADLE